MLEALLLEAIAEGAVSMRLVPGRPALLVSQLGETELAGAAFTAQAIDELLDPTLTPEARRSLASGWASWDHHLPGAGVVRIQAETRRGQIHASFDLERRGRGRGASGLASSSSALRDPLSTRRPSALGAPGSLRQRASAQGARDSEAPGALPPQPPEPLRTARAPAPLLSPAPPELVELPADPAPPQLWSEPPAPRAATPSSEAVAASRSSRPSVAPRRKRPPSGGSSAEIDELLATALDLGASDIHVTSGAPPVARNDGKLVAVQRVALDPEAVERMLWPIVPARGRDRLFASHDLSFAYEIAERGRFRVSMFFDRKGMGAAFRAIPAQPQSVEELALPRELLSLCRLTRGLVLVAGPAGSGKSTTLAALIDAINRTRSDRVITIESPIEHVHQNRSCLISQREVGEHTDSPAAALHAAMNEDPDVVMVSELGDAETTALALEMAEKGRLVLSTLHTISAVATLERIVDRFAPADQARARAQLADSLKGVIVQTLCRRNGGGRVAAFEILFGVSAVAPAIREGKLGQIPGVVQAGRKLGMRLLNDSLLELVRAGTIGAEEALLRSRDAPGLRAALDEAGIAPRPG